MRPVFRAGWIFLAAAVALLLVLQVPAAAGSVEDDLGEKEVELGKEAAAEVAKDSKLSDNADDLKRLREMGAKVAAVANATQVEALYGSPKITPFEYTFDIIEEDDVNAFCVPGGRIFVYRGLLDFVQSDHELAGVLAHEITHAAHHHMVYLLKKQASLNNAVAIALLATMLGGGSSTDVGNVVLGAQLYQIAKLNGYGMQAERDADHGAVIYMQTAGYNPVGLLTFLERLAKRPELFDLGIYRSHPLDADRVKAARDLIQEMGLPINRRETTNAVSAEVKRVKQDGAQTIHVFVGETPIFSPAALGGKTAEARAQETADAINKALDSGLKMHELKVDPAGVVTARGVPVLTVAPEDAALMGKPQSQIAKTAAAAIRDVIWKQMVDTVH